jgi:hypothetical protein
VVVFLVFLVGLVWANLFYISLNPSQSSFLPRWLGTRLFLTRELSPYSPQTTAEIERTWAADGEAPSEGEAYFLSPFYSFIIYFPFALTDNQVAARVAWMTVLELAVLALLALSLNLSRWRIPAWALLLLFLFSISWYYGLRPVLDGDLSILVGLFAVASLAAIRVEQDALAGFLLALAMIQPTALLLFLVFVLIWAGVSQRWMIVWSFLGCLALVVAATSLIIPDWVAQNIRQVFQYSRLSLIDDPGSLVATWLPGIGQPLGRLLTILTGITLVIEWSLALRKDFRWFYWTACLTLAVTPLSGLPTSLDRFILLFPGLVLVLATWEERWGVVGKVLIVLILLALSAGAWALAVGPDQASMPPDLNPWLFFLLPVLLLAGLYWARWWAIRPPRLLLEEISQNLR